MEIRTTPMDAEEKEPTKRGNGREMRAKTLGSSIYMRTQLLGLLGLSFFPRRAS